MTFRKSRSNVSSFGSSSQFYGGRDGQTGARGEPPWFLKVGLEKRANNHAGGSLKTNPDKSTGFVPAWSAVIISVLLVPGIILLPPAFPSDPFH